MKYALTEKQILRNVVWVAMGLIRGGSTEDAEAWVTNWIIGYWPIDLFPLPVGRFLDSDPSPDQVVLARSRLKYAWPQFSMARILPHHIGWMLEELPSISVKEAAGLFYELYGGYLGITSHSRTYVMAYLRRAAGEVLRKGNFMIPVSRKRTIASLPEAFRGLSCFYGAITFMEGNEARHCLYWNANREQLESYVDIMKKQEDAIHFSAMMIEMSTWRLQPARDLSGLGGEVKASEIFEWLVKNKDKWESWRSARGAAPDVAEAPDEDGDWGFV